MTTQTRRNMAITTAAAAIVATLVGQSAIAAVTTASSPSTPPLLIKTNLLFDGTSFQFGPQAVLVQNGKILKVGPASQISAPKGTKTVNIPTGTILPGFIDMHTHHLVNGVPARRMLEHGVTTARDLGSAEPITAALTNKPYQLRQFFSGPILQAPNGYPNVVFPGSGVEVTGETAARAKVDSLIAQGASVIAVSLEEGGEPGAPWNWHEPAFFPPWATLSNGELAAIVDQAHNTHHVKVTAYFGNDFGAQRALAAGVDEWAHSPCDRLTAPVITEAGAKKIAIDGTIDTEVACEGALDNAAALVHAGAKLFYSTDMGHPDIPHGIDAQEIHMGLHVGFHNGKDYLTALAAALASATSEAGTYLGVPQLGKIEVGAPADIIVTGSSVLEKFKELEFPRLVVKGGLVVIERAAGQ
ncbi:MAG: amidohydrolase family protein [Methylococcaceae bacterium]|nr:amidohydrolase family protein [Methylococcaceae bacterium]